VIRGGFFFRSCPRCCAQSTARKRQNRSCEIPDQTLILSSFLIFAAPNIVFVDAFASFVEILYSRFGTPSCADATESLLFLFIAAYSRLMRIFPFGAVPVLVCAVLLTSAAHATPKVHVITFGKWTSVQSVRDSGTDDKPLILVLKIRALSIDGRVKEYALGAPHDVTERLFVVRRAFRMNDSLPDDPGPRWQWQRGGWLLVDRLTGRISPLNLPEFDISYSAASWYRDYVAYCGVGDDGKKTYAVVAQIGRRKPVLRRPLSTDGVPDGAAFDSACPAPSWQRSPVRVSFESGGGVRQTYAIRGHGVDMVNDADDEEEGSK
jgi:hypothetical protein